MTERVAHRQCTYDEVARTIAQHIHDYRHNNGPDLQDAALVIPCDDFPIEKRLALWTKARRDKLAGISARFNALRPRIDEAKAKLERAKLAKEKVRSKRAEERDKETARLLARLAQRKAATAEGQPFILPTTQPEVESAGKDNSVRKAVIAKFVEANRDDLAHAKPEAEPEEEPAEERFHFDEEVTTPVLSKAAPMDNAVAFARDRLYTNGNLATYYYKGEWWQWNGRFYEIAPADRISAAVYIYLHHARAGDERFKPKPEHAEALMKCLKANIAIDDRDVPPRWLPKTPAELAKRDAGDLLAFRNCLVDVKTGEVVEPTPHLWTNSGVDFDFDERALCPRWEQFLEEVFPDDPESQMTIEEQLGCGMTFDNRYEKGAMWIGAKRSGKSTLAWMQEQLTGTGACVSLSFHDWVRTENSHEHPRAKGWDFLRCAT